MNFSQLRLLILSLLPLFGSSSVQAWTFWTPGDSVDNSTQLSFGGGYRPNQPAPFDQFSHKLHAGDRGIPCQYCHSSARRSTAAGIPSMNTCVGCHKFVNTDAEPIRKLKEMYEKNEPIKWTKVHDLPDFVRFSHKVHVLAKDPGGQPLLQCQTCHGPVEKTGVAEQWAPLQMGWCVDCHNKELVPATKDKPAKKYARTTCNTCHF